MARDAQKIFLSAFSCDSHSAAAHIETHPSINVNIVINRLRTDRVRPGSRVNTELIAALNGTCTQSMQLRVHYATLFIIKQIA